MALALHLSAFSVGWGPKQVLGGLDLELEHGSCLCIVGPGGSGKSSCVRAIQAILAGQEPSERELWWRGQVHAAVAGCAYLRQAPRAEAQDRFEGLQRTVAREAELHLFDEPLVGLDPARAEAARGQLQALREAGGTMIVVTHYLPLARELGDHLALLVDGELIEQGRGADFFERPRRARTREYIKWGA